MESKIKYKIKWEREKKYILNGIGGIGIGIIIDRGRENEERKCVNIISLARIHRIYVTENRLQSSVVSLHDIITKIVTF